MFRIAPTPSGHLHIGNAFSFLLTRKLADAAGDRLLLRIDDLDSDRKRPEYVQDVFEVLDWLGIRWEVGPKGVDDFENNWSQQTRLSLYDQELGRLIDSGNLYACKCSRKEIAELSSYANCPCKNENLSFESAGTALKVSVPENTIVSFTDENRGEMSIDLAAEPGDFVVRRRDGIPAYQVASLVDDIHFKVTTIVRGEDLMSSTVAQLHLARILGHDTFSKNSFIHHSLILDDGGKKLSKSDGALSLKHLISTGVTRSELEASFKIQLALYGV